MAARRIPVRLTLEAAKYISEAAKAGTMTESVREELGRLDRKVAEVERDMGKLAGAAAVAKREVSSLGGAAVRTGVDLKALDERIKAQRTSVKQLGDEWLTTGEKATLVELRKARSGLRELERIRREAASLVPKIQPARILSQPGSGIPMAPAAIGAAVVAVAALSPVIAAMVSGAVIGAVGAGGMVGGIVSAIKDPRVDEAFQGFTHRIGETFFAGGGVFVKPIEDGLRTLETAFNKADFASAFAKAAPYLDEFAGGIGNMVDNLMPGFNRVMDDVRAVHPRCLGGTVRPRLGGVGHAHLDDEEQGNP